MSFLTRVPRADPVALPPEIGFLLVQGVPWPTLARAVDIARTSGTDAVTAILHAGLISEEAYYRGLAHALGTAFLDRPALGPGASYPDSLVTGSAPLADGWRIAAPRGPAVPTLLAASRSDPLPAITTPTRLREAVFTQRAEAVARHASDDLGAHHPDWSCRPGPQSIDLTLMGVVAGMACLLAQTPTVMGLAILALTQLGVLAMLTIRLATVCIPAETVSRGEEPRLTDAELPTYTVFVALYREARVMPRLIHSLAKLDYPPEKLDIKLLLEADDPDTAEAVRRASLPPRFEVVTVPPGLPRTKPRALNAALPLARGDCLVVYDAEDVPDPGQLREAAERFARASIRTACLQGRLVIDNAGDTWLTRCFAIEYAALFDVLGPALAAWRMPTPLGGTSTHFRTRVLRELRGWDAWNVTEDADLGIRLALAGYHVGDLPSSTYEEAPKHLKSWLRQRTRWMKGFLQTSFTHGRTPLAAYRRLGPAAGLCAVALVPGTVASALFYPFVMLPATVQFLAGAVPCLPSFAGNLPSGTAGAVLIAGFAAMLAPAVLGCLRRGWRDALPTVPWLPVYYLLVSVAAWLAVFELMRHPYRWNKTEHGLARTSRTGALRLRRRPATVT